MKKLLKTLSNSLALKKLHKWYLIIALTLTTLFSLFMPIFNEPDGQYHLAVSGTIVNSVVDTSRYGIDKIASGMREQEDSYKNGTHFEKYYLNKAVFIESKKLPRNIYFSYYYYFFWGHLIPSFGLFLGRFIYPSLGVMVTVARLVSSVSYVFILTYVIKKVKKGKLLFTTIYLSPVVLNSFASLSYDAAGYALVALFMMQIINIIVNKKVESRFLLFLSVVLLFIGAKQNYWIISLLLPVALAETQTLFGKKLRFLIGELIDFVKSHVKISLGVLGVVAVGLMIMLTSKYGGLLSVARRFFMTTVFNYGNTFGINTWLAEPYPSYNNMPSWTTATWVVLVVLVLLTQDKFVKNKLIPLISLFLFITGIVGVYFIQLGYGSATTSYIEGVQGRYFTPTILLLLLVVSSFGRSLELKRKNLLSLSVFVIAIVSNLILLFNTVIDLMR
ncbi:TPA: DUF2142 domain-containing protein [Streptococcus suis]|nr:DUF2142 domain-containing protein [Streptococcus suis]